LALRNLGFMTSASLIARPASPRLVSALGHWRRALVGAIAVWFTAHLALSIWAIIVHLVEPRGFALFSQPDWYFRLFFAWDSNHFFQIATYGYFAPTSHATLPAFFPGYPEAARRLSDLVWGVNATPSQLTAAMWAVSLIASLIAAVLLWRLVEQEHGSRIAAAATILFLAGPYAVFLQASYSESLYLACAIAAWMFTRRGAWLPAGIMAAFASFTRVDGLFLIAALAVLFITVKRRRGEPILLRLAGLVTVGVSGIGLYFVYLFAATGDPLAWSHAETAGWHRTTSWPWVGLSNSIHRAVTAASGPTRLESWLDIVFAVLLVIGTVHFLRNKQWAEATLVGLTTISLTTSSTYMSIGRESLAVFPLFILVATTLAAPKRKWIFWTALLVGGVLLATDTAQFTLGLWAD
jgi:hypothetical protein